jgi:hypothetical protein
MSCAVTNAVAKTAEDPFDIDVGFAGEKPDSKYECEIAVGVLIATDDKRADRTDLDLLNGVN